MQINDRVRQELKIFRPVCSNHENILARLWKAAASGSCYTLLVNRLEYFSIDKDTCPLPTLYCHIF